MRRRMKRSKDKRKFSNTADKTHKFNFSTKPRRGGWRL